MVRDIIKPATAATRCRYVDLPEVRASGAVGAAVTFVSHTWGAKWGTLVSALADGGADRNRRVWVDVFAVRQWGGNGADLAFEGVIARCSSFAVVCQAALLCEGNRQDPNARGAAYLLHFDAAWLLEAVAATGLAASVVAEETEVGERWCIVRVERPTPRAADG